MRCGTVGVVETGLVPRGLGSPGAEAKVLGQAAGKAGGRVHAAAGSEAGG